MARVTFELPSLLAPLADGRRGVPIEAATLAEALKKLFEQLPTLRPHVLDESDAFRQHVLCFLNDTNSRWLESLEAPLRDGDTITILQAVSGG